ncbi:histidinol-phosphate transaminase [Acinetobacter sp. c3-l95]|uniref:histidinol-phosphate transaminase n=1 Tax=Acinetobacter sp. c3-l95 TaxID=3342804 RepID=UPI0035B7BB88
MNKLNDINSLARLTVQELTAYQSARKIGGTGTVWLNANEAPQTPCDELSLGDAKFNRYPEPQPSKLIARYADYAGLNPTQVLATRGGDEGIELVIRTFCEPTDSIVICPPTYGMYAISAKTAGVGVIEVMQTPSFGLDLDGIAKAMDTQAVKVVFVCSPNNPTGNVLPERELTALFELCAGRAMVVLDEAYIEYAKNSYASKLADYPHVVIIRTLSKAFGLAGLRCGFVLANSQVIELLSKVIAPYPIAVPVAVLAEQALSPSGIAKMQQAVLQTLAEKQRLASELKTLPSVEQVFDSETNYLLVRFNDSPKVFEQLWQAGIILRHQHHNPMLENCIRITVGSVSENDALLNQLRTVLL